MASPLPRSRSDFLPKPSWPRPLPGARRTQVIYHPTVSWQRCPRRHGEDCRSTADWWAGWSDHPRPPPHQTCYLVWGRGCFVGGAEGAVRGTLVWQMSGRRWASGQVTWQCDQREKKNETFWSASWFLCKKLAESIRNARALRVSDIPHPSVSESARRPMQVLFTRTSPPHDGVRR